MPACVRRQNSFQTEFDFDCCCRQLFFKETTRVSFCVIFCLRIWTIVGLRFFCVFVWKDVSVCSEQERHVCGTSAISSGRPRPDSSYANDISLQGTYQEKFSASKDLFLFSPPTPLLILPSLFESVDLGQDFSVCFWKLWNYCVLYVYL